MRGRTLALLLSCVVFAPRIARAEVDPPIDLRTPSLDLAVALAGGVAFDESGTQSQTGFIGGLDLTLLESLFGITAGFRFHPEGRSTRVVIGAEISVWYALLVGVGVSHGWLLGDGGPGVPEQATALSLRLGVPIPLADLDGAGSLLLLPYGRASLRFVDDGVQAHHELGIALAWSTWGGAL